MPKKKRPERVTIRNHLEGTRLHLGDGRVIEFDEKAEVSAEIAHNLTKSGQAE